MFFIAFLLCSCKVRSRLDIVRRPKVDCRPSRLTERGTTRAVIRSGKHFMSLSPIFEVFPTQIQTHSILSNPTFGGARYIATGRGFATTRISFSILYSRFAGPSIDLGMRTLIMLLYVILSVWLPHLIYFWFSVLALCVSPCSIPTSSLSPTLSSTIASTCVGCVCGAGPKWKWQSSALSVAIIFLTEGSSMLVGMRTKMRVDNTTIQDAPTLP